MAIRISRRKRPLPAIDMTPMIDCVFQLLIFFMLSSSFQAPMIQLSLPAASTHDPAAAEEILVTVSAKREFYLNRDLIEPADLEKALRVEIAKSKHKVVTFRGDKDISYQWFVQALDAARSAGAKHVDIVHDVR